MYCCDKDVERNIYVSSVNDSAPVTFIASVIIHCTFKNLLLSLSLYMSDNNADLFCNV